MLAAVAVGVSLSSHPPTATEQSLTRSPDITSSGASRTDYLINMRVLEGAERDHYVQQLSAIERQLQSSDPVAVVRAVDKLASGIDALPDCVQDDTKETLYNKISERLANSTSPLRSVATALLDSSRFRCQLIALDALEHDENAWWLTDDRMSRTLVDLLASRDTDVRVRRSILGTFWISQAFDWVRAFAWAIARDEGDPALARSAAFYACASLRDESFRSREVVGAFVTSSGVLRQEAALALARFYSKHMSSSIRSEVIDELVAMAADKRLPAIVRGDAIEELGRWSLEPAVLNTLSSLLRPSEWFFGVTGHHHLEHSLSVVVPAIAGGDPAVVRPKLLELRKHVGEIEPAERFQVELELKHALENESPRGR